MIDRVELLLPVAGQFCRGVPTRRMGGSMEQASKPDLPTHPRNDDHAPSYVEVVGTQQWQCAIPA